LGRRLRPARARATGPNVVTITATDYAFGMPDTIPAGLTTFRLVNQGKELHHASLVRLGEGKTAADFQAGLAAAIEEPRAAASWITFPGGPNAVTPRRHGHRHPDARARVVCVRMLDSSLDGVPHVMKGMMHPLVVAAGAASSPAAAEPGNRCDHQAHGLRLPAVSAADRRHACRACREHRGAGPRGRDRGPDAGQDAAGLHRVGSRGEKGPLPTGQWLGGVTTLDAGGHSQFTTTFAPGSYLLLCFWPDAKDGKPHIMHGMAKQITVS